MIGSFLTRGLVMVFGYAYPAYECYKSVEKNKPDIEQLRFWCQYWILVAILTVGERFGDTFISWVPMYSEAKLAFYIYLWFPKTKGTTYVYDSFFRPYIAKHETDIDRSLLELRTRAADYAVLYWQRAASYGQTRIFDILQYVASQSTPKPRTAQPQEGAQDARARQPAAGPNRKPAASPQPETEEAAPARTSSVPARTSSGPGRAASGPSRSSSTGPHPKDVAEEAVPPKVPTPASSASGTVAALKATAAQSVLETAKSSSSSDTEAMEIEAVSSSTSVSTSNPSPEETLMEEGIRVTRGRLRKSRGGATIR